MSLKIQPRFVLLVAVLNGQIPASVAPIYPRCLRQPLASVLEAEVLSRKATARHEKKYSLQLEFFTELLLTRKHHKC